MGDRETLRHFIETHYDVPSLARLVQSVGIVWSTLQGEDTHARLEAFLSWVECENMAAILLARLETDFPHQLPPLQWPAQPASAASANPSAEARTYNLDKAQAPLLTLRDGVSDLEAARRQPSLVPLTSPAAREEDATGADDFARAVAEFEELRAAFREENEGGGHMPFRFVHGYTLPTHWARRDQEIAELVSEIRENQHRILALVAIGGTGKSALTRKLLDELPKHKVQVDGALWFSFYVEPEFDRFLTEACRYLIPSFDPKLHPSPYEKGVLLREAMEKGHFLLVLDGIEILLVSNRNRKDFGTFQDRALREFLEGVCEGKNSQVLISSRFPLMDLKGNPHHHVLQLADLSLEAADELLSSYGVQGTGVERAQIYAQFGSHALTLQILADYLTRFHAGDPRGITQIPTVAPDAPQGIKLQAALDGYWHQLQADERFFLTRMSAFRGGVEERSLIVLNKSGDAFNPEFRALVQRLIESPLLSVERREGHARLTSHPLIKTFFYERMADDERDRTHRALKDYAQGLPLPDRPHTLEDYEPLLEACHHCLQVGLYTEAYQIYRRNNMDNALRWWGHYTQARALLEPLREASQGDIPTWQSERWQRSWVENETALLAVLRGDTHLAIERFQRSAEMDAESGDGHGESASLQNLASVLTQRGDFKGAMKALEKSLLIEARLGRYEKEDMLAGLEGVCQAELGQLQTAFELLTRAVGISAQRPNYRAVCYWTWRLGDLYLRIRQPEQGQKQHAEALALAQREQFRDYEGHALRGLGDAARHQAQSNRARARYTEAMRVARTLGNPYLENEVRLSLARQAEAERNFAEVAGQAQQTLARAEESGYHTQATEAHLILARCAIETRDTEALLAHVAEAQQLLEQTYHYVTRQELDRLIEAEPILKNKYERKTPA